MLQLYFWSGFGKRQLGVMVMEMVETHLENGHNLSSNFF